MNDVTQILSAAEQGDPQATEKLLPLVYAELRKLAAARLAHEMPGQTLQATALVHDAFVRLVGGGQKQAWDSRGHFFAAAAEAMRRILVENARRKASVKHGGERRRVDQEIALPESDTSPLDILALDEALTKLAAESPRIAELVKLRYFAGMTLPEVAEALGVSVATAERDWTYARTWLYCELCDPDEDDPSPDKSAGM